ncbi:MAG: hypothetical protein Q4C72_02060 [Eubacteriales bacterium]|nr:hypothetical protein [Eubacteriales bacterium]
MDYGLLNLASLFFGLVAVILPVVSFSAKSRRIQGRWAAMSLCSLGSCALAICLQPFYTSHLVDIEDWSALIDTSAASAKICAALLGVTVLFNLLAAGMHRLDQKSEE